MKRGRVYNKIFNKDDWELVNPENIEYMEDYLEEYRSRKMKPGTLKQYRNDLRIVLIYIMKKLKNKSIIDLRKKDFRKFTLYLAEDLKVSNARSNRLMSCVRSFLDYLEDDEEVDYDNNSAKKVKGLPKEAVKDIVFLTDKQVHQLSKILLKKELYQMNAMLWILYDTGSRLNEIMQIEKPEEDTRVMNEVIGKRGKKYKPILFKKGKEAMDLWLEKRGEDDNKSLWINETTREKITNLTFYNRIIKMNEFYEEEYGENLGFGCHSFRHSFIENLHEGTHYMCKEIGKLDLSQIQKIVNHSDISTTQSYTKDKSEDEVMAIYGV